MGGRPEIISINRLKPAHLHIDCPVQMAVSLRRGCPPAHSQPGNASVPTPASVPAVPSSTQTWAHVTSPTRCTRFAAKSYDHSFHLHELMMYYYYFCSSQFMGGGELGSSSNFIFYAFSFRSVKTGLDY